MKFYYILILLLFIAPASVFAQYWSPPVPLIPNSNIHEIALARYNDSLKSYVIEYNPDSSHQAGPFVTSYFQAHEYGHIHRTHLGKNKLNQSGASRLQLKYEMERGADIYAFQTLFTQDRTIILAMINHLKNTSEEDLTNWSRLERIGFLEDLFNYHTVLEDSPKVNCTHKAHRYDSWPCSHMTREGKTLHSEDPATCTHIAHPEGDALPGSINVKNPYLQKPKKKVAKK